MIRKRTDIKRKREKEGEREKERKRARERERGKKVNVMESRRRTARWIEKKIEMGTN